MNELIKISEKNGKKVVSARDLHTWLEAGSNHTTWFKNQSERAMLEEGQDFIQFSEESTGGRPTQDYAISLNAAKEISMLNGGEKGKQARLYFIECEKQLSQPKELSRKELALMVVRAEEEKEQAMLLVENLNTVLDNLLDWISIIKVSEKNKVSEKLFNWRILVSKSNEMGYQIKKAQSARYKFQNLYNVNVFKAVYPQFSYNFK